MVRRKVFTDLKKRIVNLKLLFIQDALVNAGAERSHLEILSRFSDQLDVTLVYFYPKHELKAEYEKSGIRLIFLDIPESHTLVCVPTDQ